MCCQGSPVWLTGVIKKVCEELDQVQREMLWDIPI